MDKNSECNVPKQGSPKKTHRSPDEEKKNQQESRDEPSQLTESDERSNVDAFSKLPSALPEDLDESVTSIKSDSAETVKSIPGLSVQDPSADSTSLLEQGKEVDNLFERQQSLEECVNLSNVLSEVSQTIIQAIHNMNRILSTEQVNKISIQESGSSAADISSLPEEKYQDALMNKEENHTNSAYASEKDLKSPFQTHFSEISKGQTNNLSQTDLAKFTGGNVFDFKKFSDRGCQTDHIKFVDSSLQTDSMKVDVHCQTDPINSLEDGNQVKLEKFAESQTYEKVYSTEDPNTLKPSKSESYAPESFLYKSDTSENSEWESNMARFAGCESGTEESEKRQTHSEQFSDSQKNSDLSHSPTDSSDLSHSRTDSSELSQSQTNSSEYPQSMSISTGYPSSRTDPSDVSMESLDSVTDSSELSGSRTYSLTRRHRVPELSNLPPYSWNISDFRPHLSDNEADTSDVSDSQTNITQTSDSLTDVTELSEKKN